MIAFFPLSYSSSSGEKQKGFLESRVQRSQGNLLAHPGIVWRLFVKLAFWKRNILVPPPPIVPH